MNLTTYMYGWCDSTVVGITFIARRASSSSFALTDIKEVLVEKREAAHHHKQASFAESDRCFSVLTKDGTYFDLEGHSAREARRWVEAAQVLRTRRIPLRGAQAGAACPRACTGMHGQWLTSTDDSTAAVRQMRKRARRGNGQM